MPIVNSVSATSGVSAASAAPPAPAEIDFQNFLRLLTAQLRHQDPLSPTDSTQFVSQLASFSSVEQLVSANTKLDQISERLANSDLVSLGGLLGKTAESEAPTAQIASPIAFRVPADPTAEKVDLVVRDRFGVEVARTPVQNSATIQHWAGLNGAPSSNGPFYLFGEYFSGGEAIYSKPATTLLKITSIRESNAGVLAGLEGGVEIALSAVKGFSE